MSAHQIITLRKLKGKLLKDNTLQYLKMTNNSYSRNKKKLRKKNNKKRGPKTFFKGE